jgi:hypothetical protein
MGCKKAQVSGLDLILAIMLFSMAIILFSVLWNVVQYNVKTSADADIIAIQVANRLLDSPGYPSDWNATNVQLIGLSSERGVIDQSKFQNLINMLGNGSSSNYTKARELLGLGPYQLCVSLTYPNGTVTQGGNCNFGNTTSVSIITRTALFGEVVVHNNSITFIFDSSGSMDWFSKSWGYAPSKNLSSSWVNIYNVSFNTSPPAAPDDFDFVLEFDTSFTGGSAASDDVVMRITSPKNTVYVSCHGTGCSCGSGCLSYGYSGALRMNFSKTLWNASGVWKVEVRKTISGNLPLDDLMVQTRPRRIDGAKDATKNFVNVIATESKGIDEMSLYNFSKNSAQGCPNYNMVINFTVNYTKINYSIGNMSAYGATPIAESIKRAADSINASYYNSTTNRTHAMMIVVSDGSETCDGDVVAAANYAMGKVHIKDFGICTVGFAQGSTGELQLRTVASIGKCRYYSARNEGQLAQALTEIYFGNLEKESVVINIVVWR